MNKFLVFAITIVVSVTSFAQLSKQCEQVRGALDIGSGTTKALVAKINVCEKRILRVIFDEKIPVPFNEAYEKNGSTDIPMDFVETAAVKMGELVKTMRAKGASQISGVATSVFRMSSNGALVVRTLALKLHARIKIISQEQEAILGAKSAILNLGMKSSENVVVWDIGGGSMQITAQGEKGDQIYQGSLASVGFKNMVIDVLQMKDSAQVASPNPIGAVKDQALRLSQSYARLHLPAYFKTLPKDARFIGTGGLLSQSIQNQVAKGKNSFTAEQLEAVYNEKSMYGDDKLTGDYKSTDVTNLALVLGYMKAMGISQVETTKASLGQAVMFEEGK